MRRKNVTHQRIRKDLPLLASFQLFPGMRSVKVLSVTEEEDGIHVVLNAIKSAAKCPVCSRPSRRIHSRYQRTVADLPWAGRSTRRRTLLPNLICRTLRDHRRSQTHHRFCQDVAWPSVYGSRLIADLGLQRPLGARVRLPKTLRPLANAVRSQARSVRR